MPDPEGDSDRSPLRSSFNRRLKLEFHGSRVTSDAGRQIGDGARRRPAEPRRPLPLKRMLERPGR